MEARILKSDGTLGKKIYKIDISYDMFAIQKRLDKTLLGIGKWRNTSEPFFLILPDGFNNYFSRETLKEILIWMDSIKVDE